MQPPIRTPRTQQSCFSRTRHWALQHWCLSPLSCVNNSHLFSQEPCKRGSSGSLCKWRNEGSERPSDLFKVTWLENKEPSLKLFSSPSPSLCPARHWAASLGRTLGSWASCRSLLKRAVVWPQCHAESFPYVLQGRSLVGWGLGRNTKEILKKQGSPWNHM